MTAFEKLEVHTAFASKCRTDSRVIFSGLLVERRPPAGGRERTFEARNLEARVRDYVRRELKPLLTSWCEVVGLGSEELQMPY